jgi:hypothetical protein
MQNHEDTATEAPTVADGVPPEDLVENIVPFGETFAVYPLFSTGHIDCRIISARLITEEADCPKKWMQGDPYISIIHGIESEDYYYDQWFLPDGPLEKGGYLIRLDVEMTNVDAVANVVGCHDEAFYKEPDLFWHQILILTDLKTIDSYGSSIWFHPRFLSEKGKYFSEDDRETDGVEDYALRLPIGETKQMSFIYPINSAFDGTPRDLRYLYCLISNEDNTAPGFTYIDLNLEEAP